MKAEEAAIRLSDYLSPLEQSELKDIDFVYYFNVLQRKAKATEPKGVANDGWDNEEGEYLFVLFDHLNF